MKWTDVNNYKELPIGHWLVELEPREYTDAPTHHVAVVRKGCCIIGHYFGHDEDRVIAYLPLPLRQREKSNG